MPTAPVYGNQNAQSRVVPGVFKQPNRTAADYGATDALGKMAQVAENVYIQESAQRASKASTIAAARKQELLTKVKSEYRGERAIEGETVYKQMAQQIDDEYRSDLQGNPYALNKYNESAQVTDASMSGHVTGWMLTERDQAANATDEAAFKRSVTEAANIATQAVGKPDMQAMYNAALLSAQESQANLLRRARASEAAIKQANSQLQGQVNAQVVDIFLEINDTRRADTWFKATSHTMDPAKRADLQGKLQKFQEVDVSSEIAVSAAQEAIKANPLSPDLAAVTQAIMADKRLNGEQKLNTLKKAESVVVGWNKQIDAKSYARYLEGNAIATKLRIDNPNGSPSLALAWSAYQKTNYDAIMQMREPDRKALEASFLNPPVLQANAEAVRKLANTPASMELDPSLLQQLPIADKEIAIENHKLKQDKSTAEATNELNAFVTLNLAKKSALSGAGNEKTYDAVFFYASGKLRKNPDLYKSIKTDPDAAKKFFDDIIEEKQYKRPYLGLSTTRAAGNMEIITSTINTGSLDDKQAIGDEIMSWGVAYHSNKTREELITAPMKVLAASYTPRPESPVAKIEGDRWEAWQKVAKQTIGGPTNDVMLIDRRAYNLMLADMRSAEAFRVTEEAGKAVSAVHQELAKQEGFKAELARQENQAKMERDQKALLKFHTYGADLP